MCPNDDKTPSVPNDDSWHQVLLDKLKEQDARMEKLEKQNNELIDFNKKLLSSGPVRPVDDSVTVAMSKFEEYMKEK